MKEADQPITDLDAKYRAGLNAYLQNAQQRGNLEAVVAAKTELESFRGEGERNFDEFPGLKRLREIFEAEDEKLQAEVRERRLTNLETYRDTMSAQVESLTKSGEIDKALDASKRVETAEANIAKLKELVSSDEWGLGADARSDRVLWEFKSRASVEAVRDCQIKTTEEGIQLSSGERVPWVKSRREFKPPFRIRARVMTDSTNIRFYYGKNTLAIFNWEMNPAELRIHDPQTNRNYGFAGQGEVKTGRMQDIEIDVKADGIVVKRDGHSLGSIQGSFEDMETFVGIGPGFGSVVTVEKMEVISLE